MPTDALALVQLVQPGSKTLGAGAAGGMAVDLLALLATAALVGLVLGRVKLAAIPGYLIAGAIAGPHAIGLIDDAARVEEIGSIATVLLMFGIGLHLDISNLRHGAARLIGAGVGSTLLSVLLLWPAGMAFGVEAPVALAVAMALAMRSPAVVLQALPARRELFTPYGRLSLAVLVVQDLAVVAVLPLMPLLAAWNGQAPPNTGEGGAIGMISGGLLALSGIAALAVAGKVLAPRVLAEAARHTNQEVQMVTAAALALGFAVATGALGLSPELGAFMAGFLLSATPFRFHLSGQLAPMRDLFMAVFFTAVGLRVDIVGIAPDWWVVLAGVVLVLGLKGVSIAACAWAAAFSPRVSIYAGASLAQSGEFSLIVLGVAAAAGVMPEGVASIVIAITVCTLILTPSLMQGGRWACARVTQWPQAPWFNDRGATVDAEKPGDGDDRPRVLVAGFGPVGRASVERLEQAGAVVTILELNTATVRRQQSLGRRAVYGDVANLEVLLSAGIESADAVVVTVPDLDAMLRAVRAVRRLRPDVHLAVRAGLMSGAIRARELGADHVTVEEVAAAGALADAVLTRVGRSQAKAAAAARAQDLPPDSPIDPAAEPPGDSLTDPTPER